MAKAKEGIDKKDLDPATQIVFDVKGGDDVLRGDVYWDSMLLAKTAYETLGKDAKWEDLNTYAWEGMRSEAQHIYFFGPTSANPFQLAVLQVLGRDTPVPTLTALNPEEAGAGDPSLLLRCVGTNFAPESQVMFDGKALPTEGISGTEIQALVDPKTAGAGSYAVLVHTEGLADTSSLTFTVKGTATKKQIVAHHEAKHEPEPEKPVRRR